MYKNKLILILLFSVICTGHVASQPAADFGQKSPGGAFLRSLLLPGLGQRYVSDGSWKGNATAYLAADAALWLGLASTIWRESALTDNYRTIAASEALVNLDGKDRTFFLNLANFSSSEEYREALVRGRQWSALETAELPENEWEWTSDGARLRYSSAREDAESMKRQRPILIGLLAANRLLSAIGALQAARKSNESGKSVSFSLLPPVSSKASPVLHLRYQF